ncbi:MAG TPA: hypothetical protein VHT75_17715 [Acidimicrobiales bacterium]|nr:hypothetical protein [Acidimicrobiales bacterium]
MNLIPAMQLAVASAKGSPGVTSLALALGLVWPGQAIIGELDPAGADLAARVPVPGAGGMAVMAAATGALRGQELAECLQPATATCSLLLGPSEPDASARTVEALAAALPVAARAADVAGIWDLGRLWPTSPAWAALTGCDLVSIVVRPAAGELAHAIPLLEHLLRSGLPVGVIVAAPGRRRRAAHPDNEVANAIAERLGTAVPILGRVPFDPLGVSMAERLMVHWAGRCALGGAARNLLRAIATAGGTDDAASGEDRTGHLVALSPTVPRDAGPADTWSIAPPPVADGAASCPSVEVGRP